MNNDVFNFNRFGRYLATDLSAEAVKAAYAAAEAL